MRMKKIIFSLVLASFLVGGSFVSAHALDQDDQGLPSSGITPDSSFYFLKEWKEKIQLFLTLNAENKAKQYLHLAEVRLAEYQKMIDKGKTEIAEKTLEKYEDQLSRALGKIEKMKQKGKDIKDISQKLEDKIAKHTEVLEKNLQKVPGAGKKGIEKALDASSKVLEKVKGPKDEAAGWKTYRHELGFEFRYPEKLDMNYIGVVPEGWPPKIDYLTLPPGPLDPKFFCNEKSNLKTEFGYGSREKIIVNSNTYCLTRVSEGAAGSNYITYIYKFIKNDKSISLKFILRYINCSSFTEVNDKMKECEKEQGNFDSGVLADKIISTLKFSTNPIEVFTPNSNETVKSPIKIEGRARGLWFFEGSFPIKLLDGNGKEIVTVVAQAQGDWMTENFVNFKATVEFGKPQTEKGVIVFEKDNPSGLPQNADKFRVPVVFGK